MKSLLLIAALMVSGAAFAEGGAKLDAKAAKAECRNEAKKAGKKLSRAELKDCVKSKAQ